MKLSYTHLISAICCMGLLTAACVNKDIIETEVPDETSQEITLTALLPEGDPETKVNITDDVEQRALKVEWNQGGQQRDQFYMLNENGSALFTQASTGSSTFKGTLPTPVVINRQTTYYAAYPGSGIARYNDGVPSLQYLLNFQNGSLSLTSKCYMRGIYSFGVRQGIDPPSQVTGEAVNFSHLTAVLKPTFTKMTKNIEKIVIEISGDVKTNGWFNLKDGSTYGGDSNTIEINYSASEAVNKDRYIFLPPIPEGTELTFIVCTADNGIYRGKIKAKVDIKPGNLYTASVAMTRISTRKWSNGIQPSSSVPGDGTEDNPYQIHDAYDLQWFLNQSITSGKYYKLINNITISSEGSSIYEQWEPRAEFSGTFDGNGNTISGDMIVKPNNSTTQYAGFVGYNFGTIKNLTIDAYVGIENSQDDCHVPYIGGIAGVNKGTISKCYVKGTVIAPFSQYGCNTGGIAGFNFGGTIENCINYASIYGSEYNKSDIPAYVGGITGGNTVNGTASGYIKGCTNNGKIEGAINPKDGTCYSGGIAGKNFRSGESTICYIINDCINTGKVTIVSRGTNYYGGLTGYNEGNVCTCCKDQSSTGKAIGGGKGQTMTTINGCGTH